MITKHIWTNVCLLAIMMTISSFVGTRTVFADGWSGENDSGGSHTDSGNCSKNGDWDSCGAGFIRMDVNDPNPTRLISNWTGSGYEGTKAYITNTVVPACKKVGASEFYLLVLHVFQGGKPTGTFGLTRKVGDLITGYEGAQNWMGTRYRPGSNALAFSEVLANYKHARYTYAPAHPEQNWGDFLTKPWSNVTAFCWNPKWKTEEAETSFGAFSIVVSDEVNNGSRNSTYPTQDSKKTWEITSNEDKVRVTFAHKFFYYGGNKLSSNTIEQASTDWQVRVTRDGQGYYEPDLVVSEFIDPFYNMAGTYSVPGYNKNASFSGSDGSGCPGNICNEDVGVNTYDIDISNLKLGESTVVCSEISYDPKAFLWRSENGNPFKIIKRINANKSSTGCVKITRGAGENVEFWSNSSVEAVSGGNGRATSENDRSANLKIQLKEDDTAGVDVRFWHNIHYDNVIAKEVDNDLCTTFTFAQKNGGGTPNIISDDNPNMSGSQYCASKHDPISQTSDLYTVRGNEGEAVGKMSNIVHISSPQKGESTEVCQTINYQPKRFMVFQDQKTSTVTSDDGNNTRGSSTACVIITKEKGMDDPETSIDTPEHPFYTGEEDQLVWKTVVAPSSHTKKLVEGKIFYFQVPVDVDVSSDPVSGTDKTNKTPETWFKEKSQWTTFNTIKSFRDPNTYHLADTTNPPHSPEITPEDYGTFDYSGTSINIVVPDKVGDKICQSVGRHYQEWEVKAHENEHLHRAGYWTGTYPYQSWVPPLYDTYYTYEKIDDYWEIEGATCHTIVKKPSTNIWNGSLSTQAGVMTTISNRYNKTDDPNLTISEVLETKDWHYDRHKFGSWTEYLAVVKGQVSGGSSDKSIFGFGSGASLAYRGSSSNSILLDNSPLTIANSNGSDAIGLAGINSSGTFLSRLTTYLTESKLGDKVEIIRTSSIDHNIGDTASARTIYDLPQTIIISDGDLNISPNVTNINAWIIAPNGTVNTCDGFQDGETQAYVSGYNDSNSVLCSKQLTINGPIIAKNVKLNRTAGSDPITYDDISRMSTSANVADRRTIPGEVFNLSASTYLWAYAQASRLGSSYTEAYSRELPPRY